MTTKKRIEKLERKANPKPDYLVVIGGWGDDRYEVGGEIMTKEEVIARYGEDVFGTVIILKWADDNKP